MSYNENLNTETGGSKTTQCRTHTHWVVRKTYSKTSPSGLSEGNCRSGQTLKTPKYLSSCERDECGCGEGPESMCE